MMYRVKFDCYWHNTGMGDNHIYTNNVDFNTFEEANDYLQRVNEQYNMCKRYESNKITYSEYLKWSDSFKTIEVENGFIESEGKIVKYYPEREENI